MFGNIMNNKQIIAAEAENNIKISGFSSSKLKKIHYPLTTGKLYSRGSELPDGDYSLALEADFTIKNGKKLYEMRPSEFLIVEIKEWITMKDHFVGHFLPSSTIVMKGLSLTAGRIEAPFGDYGDDVQMVRFGLKNLTDMPTSLRATDIIAYVYFVDIRGLNNETTILSPKERERYDAWARRLFRAQDDGPTSTYE